MSTIHYKSKKCLTTSIFSVISAWIVLILKKNVFFNIQYSKKQISSNFSRQKLYSPQNQNKQYAIFLWKFQWFSRKIEGKHLRACTEDIWFEALYLPNNQQHSASKQPPWKRFLETNCLLSNLLHHFQINLYFYLFL